MDVIAQATRRMLDRVQVRFTDAGGNDLLPGGRWFDAAEWDADPKRAIAEAAEFIAARQAPVAAQVAAEAPVSMSQAEIDAELAKKAQEKADAEEARSQAAAGVQADDGYAEGRV